MIARLVALTAGPDILLDRPILLLGRDPECDIQINSPAVSRRHCCIAQVGDSLAVRDLGSTNGTLINGVRVAMGELRPGDELAVGHVCYRVRWSPAEGGSEVAGPEARKPRAAQGAAEPAILQSSDQPIRLTEAPSLPRSDPPSRVAGPRFVPPGDSPVLPEHLELAPLSGSLPPRSR